MSDHHTDPILRYGLPDQPPPTATTPDQAVHQILQGIWPPHFPNTVPVVTYRPVTIDPATLTPLDSLLEQLDEEHADPDETASTTPTPKMLEAQQAFIQAVLQEYQSFLMEEVSRDHHNVAEWLTRHPNTFPDTAQRNEA